MDFTDSRLQQNAGGTIGAGSGTVPNRTQNFSQGAMGDPGSSGAEARFRTIQANADPNFHSTSLLALPNVLRTGNAESMQTYQRADPYDSSMQQMVKQQAAGGGNGVMNT